VKPDPRRVEAILSFPPPKNQKQLRRFLGVCNYHHRFVINYANYTAPLLQLLRKGNKWKWTSELQQAFEKLGAKFAESVHLIHPDETLPYTINTDATCKAIGGVLMQTNNQGETHIVSTASRVLSPAEQRFTVAEQELLAIMYSLQKFRNYVYGHKIYLNTDNKALTFINKCTMTSNRIARWVLQLQDYDIEIKHISGARNFLTDTISRNPAGLSEQERRKLSEPKGITIAAVDLHIDKSVERVLRSLATIQARDPKLSGIIRETMQTQDNAVGKYLVRQNTLYCKECKNYPYWRAVLPDELEGQIIKYTHESLGHQGTAKCVAQISRSFYMRNVWRKVRRYLAVCDLCQKVKNPNRSYATEWRSRLPTKPGVLCATDLFGPLPTGRGGVKYILVVLDVFSKHMKLYALKAATTKNVSE
jgi:hypothetical protein